MPPKSKRKALASPVSDSPYLSETGRAKRPRRARAANDQGDEDEHLISGRSQIAVSGNAPPKGTVGNVVAKFEEEIATHRRNTILELQASEQTISASTRGFTTHLTSTRNDIQSNGDVGSDGKDLDKSSEELFASCKSALESYEKANGALKMRRPTGVRDMRKNWKMDHEVLKSVMEYSHVYAKRLAGCMIEGRDPKTIESPKQELDALGQMAVAQFDKSRAAARGRTWGKVVRDQVRGYELLAPTDKSKRQ